MLTGLNFPRSQKIPERKDSQIVHNPWSWKVATVCQSTDAGRCLQSDSFHQNTGRHLLINVTSHNNNNNNTRTMFMVLSSCCSSITRVHPGSRGERSTVPGGRRPLDPSRSAWTISPPVGCQLTTLTIAILLLLSPKASWYSFYHPTEGRRLSRPSWLATYRDGLPARTWSPIQVVTGPGVE